MNQRIDTLVRSLTPRQVAQLLSMQNGGRNHYRSIFASHWRHEPSIAWLIGAGLMTWNDPPHNLSRRQFHATDITPLGQQVLKHFITNELQFA